MRSIRLVVVTLGSLIVSCGDNTAVTPDAPPDMAGGDSACSDNVDNDGDGKTDYPSDPGCSAPNQDDEVDDCPDGVSCPQCGNGADDDGNGQTDFPDDPGCDSASDITEVVNDPVACGATMMIKNLPANGMDSGMLDATSTSQLTSTCSAAVGVSAIAYRLNLPMASVINASTASSTIDTVLDLRKADCDATDGSLQCNDNVSGTNDTSFLTASVPAGNYFLVVSGADTAAVGAYTINVERFTGEGAACTATAQCGPGLVCRTPLGGAGMVCTKPQCGDTLDDDGDGKNGFPTDPGCANATDNDETDPGCPGAATGCPACANGADDDNDGQMDYPNDPSCSSAGGQSEACNGEMDPIAAITMGTTTGNLIGASDDHDATCDDEDGSGTDLLYVLSLPAMRTLQIDTEGSVADTTLSLLTSACTEPSIDCDDEDGTSPGASRLTFANFAAGNYIVAVDAYTDSGAFPTGPFNLRVSGVIAPGGSCEPELTLGGALACPTTSPCEGTAGSMRCRPTLCVDGMDNDSDGKTDFPMDPGCASVDDEDESDTCASGVGPGCPECADGADNDGDNNIDMNDTACVTPSTPSEGCQSLDGVRDLVLPLTAGDTAEASATNDVSPACGASTNTAADHTYAVQLPALRNVTFSLTAAGFWDAATELYDSSCGGTALVCSDPNSFSRQDVPAGNYFYVVDGWSSAEGAYTVSVSGTIQNGGSCEVPLALSGALTCGTGFACRGTPGSRTCQLAPCNDGLDNDNDGIADFPNDAGCEDRNDTDETDTCPAGADCPLCSDGVDNDADTLIDYPFDPQCTAASGPSEVCTTSDGLPPLVLAVTPGTTVGATNDTFPSCDTSTHSAPDRIYRLDLPGLTNLTIDANTTFDGVALLLNSSCSGAPLQCRDSELLEFTTVAAGTYYFVVDGWSSGQGSYSVLVNGTIADGESCEGALALSGALTCGAGRACIGTMGSRTCEIAQCSDGIDNDSDGKIDHPFEPGCDSISDNDETDPVTPPVCGNTMDDDTDTLVDFPADYGCTSAAGTSEEFCSVETNPTSVITTTPVTGTTTGATNDFSALSCAFDDDSTGTDVTLALQLPVAVSSLVLDLDGSDFDTQISLRDAACGVEIGCNEDREDPFSVQSELVVSNLGPGNYAVIIDGYGGESGMYELSISGTAVPNALCTSPLFTSGVLSCPTGTTCTGTPARCQ